MKICQAVLKLWSGHENRRTRVTVHVFCMSSHGVQRLCEVS